MKTAAELQPLVRPHSSHVSTTRKKLENYSYGLEDQIGKGYSSQVFRGSNDLIGHTVAIKVIDLHKLTDRVLQDMLMSQISSLRVLKGSRNIIQLEEVYSTRNNIYIITEMCESGDLVRVIEGKALSQEQSAEIMEQLVHGYLEIYKNRIVHRDLKPANIFLQGKTCKIADFGFSISAQHVKDPCSYNVGSPLYMAPEVLQKNHYSYKSDIWALGIIYYELLFGSRPWSAKDEKELIEKIKSNPISTLVSRSISRMSLNFLTGTLNPDPSKRISPDELSKFCSWSDSVYVKSERYIKSSCSVSTINYKEVSTSSRASTNTSVENIIYNPVCKKVKAIIPSMPSTEKNSNLSNLSIVYTRKEIIVVRRDNSKILLSELHFCRFLYKITMKLQQCGGVSFNKVKENLKGLIYYKLGVIQSCQKSNILNLDGYEQYRFSTDFQRIMNVCKQYVSKYMDSLGHLGKHWVLNTNLILDELKIFLKDLLKYIKATFTSFESQECKVYLWLLDKFVIASDLIKLQKNCSLQEFSRNSNIESIVENDDKDLDLKAIEQRMKSLKLID